MPDRTQNESKTGEIPRDELEPMLRRYTPRPQRVLTMPPAPEDPGALTGVMPIVSEEPDDDATRDEDTPAGR